MGQKGFATLEVILMVVVIGILASIAVPRFANIGAKANTAKIQADLSTIDTAIAVYEMEKGDTASFTISDLVKAGYLQNEPKPPTSGSCYFEATAASDSTTTSDSSLKEVSTLGTAYTIDEVTVGTIKTKRALLGTDKSHTAEKFHVPKS